LIPGTRLTYANKKSDSLIITILDETRVVDGVTCCVLEERETEGGELAEISYNFYAIDNETRDVYYFGEAVDIYEDNKVVKHEGAWKSGEEGARFGLMMPGKPEVGQRFYQEIADNAKDRVEILSVSETVETPAGTFENCVHFLETSPLESGKSVKCFAPGVGMVRDDGFLLTKIEMPVKE
jgi:hypothetical protein